MKPLLHEVAKEHPETTDSPWKFIAQFELCSVLHGGYSPLGKGPSRSDSCRVFGSGIDLELVNNSSYGPSGSGCNQAFWHVWPAFSTVELYAISLHLLSVAPHRAAIGHSAASFVVITVIVVSGWAFVSSMNPPSGRSTTGGVSQATFYSGVSSQGLQLQIKLNASEVPQGGALQAHVLLVNTLSESVTLHPNFTANPNIDSWNWDDYLCGGSPVEHAFGFALLQGHYTAANLSQAGPPITLAPPVAIPCVNSAYGESYIRSVEFAPNSDMAAFSANASDSAYFKPQTIRMQLNATTGSCTESPYQYTETQTVRGTTTVTSGTDYSLSCGSNGVDSLTGYWSPYGSCTYPAGKGANGTAQGLDGSCFHQFAPGSYTIVAEDLWNQTAFGYFDALPSQAATGGSVGQYPVAFVGSPTSCAIEAFCINATLISHTGQNESVVLQAWFQNATTGQNATIRGSNGSTYAASCEVGWKSPSHCYLIAYPASNGTYKVTLVVQSPDGATLSAEELVVLSYDIQ